jgi:hypothetical protein
MRGGWKSRRKTCRLKDKAVPTEFGTGSPRNSSLFRSVAALSETSLVQRLLATYLAKVRIAEMRPCYTSPAATAGLACQSRVRACPTIA